MFTQAEFETILGASTPLLFLAASMIIYLILITGQIEAIRRAFARLVLKRWERDHRIEAYVKGLRELAEEETLG